MDKKTALIIMYASNILFMGWLGWLIAFLAGKKEVVGGRSSKGKCDCKWFT